MFCLQKTVADIGLYAPMFSVQCGYIDAFSNGFYTYISIYLYLQDIWKEEHYIYVFIYLYME